MTMTKSKLNIESVFQDFGWTVSPLDRSIKMFDTLPLEARLIVKFGLIRYPQEGY